MKLARGCRGSFLLQAVIMVAVLAMIVTGLIKMSMSRHVLSYRLTSAQQSRQQAKGLESQALACLEGSSVGVADCDPAGVSGCLALAKAAFKTETGRDARIDLSGTAPDCSLQIEVDD